MPLYPLLGSKVAKIRKIEASAALVFIILLYRGRTYNPHFRSIQFISITRFLGPSFQRLQLVSLTPRHTKASDPETGSDKQKEPNFSVAKRGRYFSLRC
jgi:hypothetical protein